MALSSREYAEANASFVRRVQRAAGITVDGRAGSATNRALTAILASAGVLVDVRDIESVAEESGVLWLSREQWGADPSLLRLGHHIRDEERRTEVWIHHTVTVDDDVTPSVWEGREEIAAHMRRLQVIRPDLAPASGGGPDVPYSAVCYITPSGGLVICEGRGFKRSGAHTPGHNVSGFGFAFAGDFEHSPPPPDVLEPALSLLGKFIRELRDCGGYSRLCTVRPDDGRAVWGHREQKRTLCPGRALWERLNLITV